MYLARSHSGTSFAAIGTYFGGRDPATVRHACKAAVLRLDANPALAAAIATLDRGWQKTDRNDSRARSPFQESLFPDRLIGNQCHVPGR